MLATAAVEEQPVAAEDILQAVSDTPPAADMPSVEAVADMLPAADKLSAEAVEVAGDNSIALSAPVFYDYVVRIAYTCPDHDITGRAVIF